MSPSSEASRLMMLYSGKPSAGSTVVDVVVVLVVCVAPELDDSEVSPRVVIGAAVVVFVRASSFGSSSLEQEATRSSAMPTRSACRNLTLSLYIGSGNARVAVGLPFVITDAVHPSV